MKEDDLKYLIKKSKVGTSDDFTDTLMNRIEMESRPSIQQTIGVSFKRLLMLCVVLIVVIGILAIQIFGRLLIGTNSDGKGALVPFLVVLFGVMLFAFNNFIHTMELSLKS